MALSPRQHLRFWLVTALVVLAVIWLLAGMLAPFITGMVVGYLLDPIVNRMDRNGLPRWLATMLVLLSFVAFVVVSLLLLLPVLITQVDLMVRQLPTYLRELEAVITPAFKDFMELVDPAQQEQLMGAANQVMGRLSAFLNDLGRGVVAFTFGFLEIVSFMIITPVVAFYMLRDWDRMMLEISGLLPRPYAHTVNGLAQEVDRTLAGFVRGQLTVCLILGLFYASALNAVGLNYGFLIGLVSGFLSFIPYVGAMLGLLASVGVAAVQFDSWVPVVITAVIFLGGQAVEGNYLTPKLVGGQVRLHPVWIIFALMAGSQLLGFVGLLLAVPLAAIIGVMLRFAVQHYKSSHFFHHGLEPDEGLAQTPMLVAKDGRLAHAPTAPTAVIVPARTTASGDIL